MDYGEEFEYEEFQYTISGNVDGSFSGYTILDGDSGEEIEVDGLTVVDVKNQLKNIIDKFIKKEK